MELGGKTYTIVVVGDVNCDGKLTATDLSQFKLAEVGTEKIEGAKLEATDINKDGKPLTVLDRSQLKMLLVGLEIPAEEGEVQLEGEIVIKASTEEAAREVTIEVEWPEGAEEYKKVISIDGGETYQEYEGPVTVNKNTTVIAQVTTKGGATIKEEQYKIGNIDTTRPKEYTITASTTTSSITIEGETTDTAEDEEGNEITEGIAGIAKYMYKLEGGEWQDEKTIKGLKPNTEYKIYGKAIDHAGNEREATNNGEIVITKELPKASEKVTIEYSEQNPTKENVIVSFKIDEEIKDMYTEYQVGGTEGKWTRGEKYIAEKNETIYVRLVDEGGQSQAGDYAIGEVTNIDKKAPKDFTPEVIDTTSSTIKVNASNTNGGKAEDEEADEGNMKSGIGKYKYYIIDKAGNIESSEETEESTYEYTNLKAGSGYTVYVEAIDKVGNKKQSETIETNTNAKQGEPGDENTTITGQKPEATYDNPIRSEERRVGKECAA